MTVTQNNKTYIFKRTDLTDDEWRAVAFEKEKDPDGKPVIDANGDPIFIPYFYEK